MYALPFERPVAALGRDAQLCEAVQEGLGCRKVITDNGVVVMSGEPLIHHVPLASLMEA